ncbi:MAG: polysaccharide biosynthesis/export family protein [Geobacteraceae bacterium]|nr:polysaccharide biosynthesis/export family protein [Geobacteraceae bacterium]
MKRIVLCAADVTILFLLFSLVLVSPASAANLPAVAVVPDAKSAAANPDYIIGSGDVLDITVWKDSTLTRSVVVLPDGMISFPLVGELKAEGKTVDELKQELEKKLARYVSDLVLSVEVRQCNSMMVYVVGRVNSPGRQVLNSRVTVLQALATAGGPNPFAKKNNISILRQDGDKTVKFDFRYDDVVEGENMSDNIMLKRGDVIVVP